MRQERSAVIHIGVEKTGTTAIQHFLSLQRDALLDDGILFPTLPRNAQGSQWGLVACATDRVLHTDIAAFLEIHDRDELEAYRAQTIRSIDAQLSSASSARRMLLSSEHFHSRLTNSEEILALRTLLERWCSGFRVLMYVRRQDRLAVSQFSTDLKSGRTKTIAFPDVSGHLPYYYDFHRVFGNWSEVFGKGNVELAVYDSESLHEGDVVRDFAARADIELAGKRLPPRANQGLSKSGADFILEVNRRMAAISGGVKNPDRAWIVSRVAALCRGKFFPVSRREARQFYRAFSASNERLAAAALGERSSHLFDHDFTEYPECFEWEQPDYREAVRIALQLILEARDSRELTRLKSNNFHLRGMLALKDGDLEAAIGLFASACEVSRDHFGANFQLARIMYDRGDLEQGKEHLRRAEANSPPGHKGLLTIREKYERNAP